VLNFQALLPGGQLISQLVTFLRGIDPPTVLTRTNLGNKTKESQWRYQDVATPLQARGEAPAHEVHEVPLWLEVLRHSDVVTREPVDLVQQLCVMSVCVLQQQCTWPDQCRQWTHSCAGRVTSRRLNVVLHNRDDISSCGLLGCESV